MTDIVEGRLLFRFPDDWHALKYDDENGFVARNCRIPDTKRVDIVAANEDRLLLIEVKDFRGHAIENRGRLDPEGEDSLHIEVAKKYETPLPFLLPRSVGKTKRRDRFTDTHLIGRESASMSSCFLKQIRTKYAGDAEARHEPTLKTEFSGF